MSSPDQEEWVQAFPERETYCRHYLLLRRLFFGSQTRDRLASVVEHAVDVLLQDQAASLFLDDGAFSAAVEELRGISRRLSSGLRPDN